MIIPRQYQPRLLAESEKQNYLGWSLDFFTDPNVLQTPCLDITLQLEVTNAYKIYQDNPPPGATFFSFLTWHLLQTMKEHTCFNFRLVDGQWYILDNPPVTIPVAVGGKERFWELTLENTSQSSYPEFIKQYRHKLDGIRKGNGIRCDSKTFLLSCLMGNLPNLQFTGLALHWRYSKIAGQPSFYFGKRYVSNDQLFIPLSVQLHHATTDPFVLDLLIQDFQTIFV